MNEKMFKDFLMESESGFYKLINDYLIWDLYFVYVVEAFII